MEPREGWGKANGLGDLEALCDLAPVQLGNRVWFDTDADGVQDGDEPAVAGVKVTATPCAGGAALPVKTTNAKGEYYFGAADGLKPETCYNLAFDYSGVNAATLPGAPAQADLKWTVKEAGADRVIDSNVDAAGKAAVTDRQVRHRSTTPSTPASTRRSPTGSVTSSGSTPTATASRTPARRASRA